MNYYDYTDKYYYLATVIALKLFIAHDFQKCG